MMHNDLRIPMMTAGCLALASLAPAQQAKLKPVPPLQASRLEKSLDHKILPPKIDQIYVDRKQVFTLVGTGSSPVTFIPLVFVTLYHDDGGDIFNCGVYILAGKVPTFAITLDASEGPVQCGYLVAMGTIPDEGAHPRILLLYSVSTPNAHLHTPAVLEWDDLTSTYALDAADTDDLQSLNADLTTIAAMRGELHPRPQGYKPAQ